MCYKKCLRLRSGNNNQNFLKVIVHAVNGFQTFLGSLMKKGPKFCKKQYFIMNSNEIKVWCVYSVTINSMEMGFAIYISVENLFFLGNYSKISEPFFSIFGFNSFLCWLQEKY